MQQLNYITATVSISGNRVLKNSLPFFEKEDTAIGEFLLALYQFTGVKYPKFYKMDNLSKLGWLGAEILLPKSFRSEKYHPEAVGIILQNASSSLDADIRYFESVKEIPSPALFVYTLPNIVIGEICIKHKFRGENAFFIFENFDAGFMSDYINTLFSNDILQACICGWVEVMGEDYKLVLYLVEKENNKGIDSVPLTTENLNKIYHLQNG